MAATDELRAHALELAARLFGDRRAVEVGDEPLPPDAEAVSLLAETDDPDRLRERLDRVRAAAESGVPAIVYVANRAAEPSPAGATPEELRRAFGRVSGAIYLEQRDVECSIADPVGEAPTRVAAAEAAAAPPRRLLVVANLPDASGAEASLRVDAATEPRRRELERTLSELRQRNLELARARTGAPPDGGALERARVAERRLLFARVREIVNALLSRRRLRG